LHDRLLALGRDPSDDRRVECELSARTRIVGNRRAVVHPCDRDPGVARDRGHGLGSVSGQDLDLDVLAAQERDRVVDVWTQRLGEHDQAKWSQPWWRLLSRLCWERRRPVSDGEHAPSLRLAPVSHCVELAERQAPGCTEIKGVIGDLDRTPAAAAGEGDFG
jgi:hypothetical protein